MQEPWDAHMISLCILELKVGAVVPTKTVSLLSAESRSFGGAGRHGAQGGGRTLQDLRLPDPHVLREGRGEVHDAAAPQQRQDHRVHAQVSHTPR